MTFTELGLQPVLQEALAKEKINVPTPVQEKALPELLAGKDAYLCAETGSGKTLAYLLPLISQLDQESKALQIIIITPTHELALQVQEQIRTLNKNANFGIRFQLLIGGTSLKRQIEKLKAKPHIVVGSAGRMHELIKMRKLKVHNVNSIVIDEADKLLFGDNLEGTSRIIRSTLGSRRLIFVSATAREDSTSVAESLVDNLTMIDIGKNQINADIEHFYAVAHENEKAEMLRKLVYAYQPVRAIVFVHRNKTAEAVTEKLAERNMPVATIHGQCDKFTRQKALDQFRKGKIKILISSDISARGLDIKGISHIFNLDIPMNSKDYLHRAGRTGRAGNKGCTVSIVTPQEVRITRRYQRDLKITMTEITAKHGSITPLQ
jgi:ATP-dependent RNA helicase DeaD